MNASIPSGNLKIVQNTAKGLNLRMTRKQAAELLETCSGKIESAIQMAAHEVIQEEVEKYLFDKEDKELGR